jgi:hypothetical protein
VACQRRQLAQLDHEIGAVEIATVARLKDDPDFQALLKLRALARFSRRSSSPRSVTSPVSMTARRRWRAGLD